jgi:hypothetical protein
MTMFRVTMTVLALAGFIGATLPAAAQDIRRPGKPAVHGKKRTAPVRQAQPTGRGVRAGEQWMDRATGSSNGGGGY